MLEPVLTYQVQLPEGANVHTALKQLSQLEDVYKRQILSCSGIWNRKFNKNNPHASIQMV